MRNRIFVTAGDLGSICGTTRSLDVRKVTISRNHAADEWKRPSRELGEAKSQFAVIFGERFVI